MSRQCRCLVLVVSALVLASLSWASAAGGGNPANRRFELPQAAFDDLVQRANRTIQEEFKKGQPEPMELRSQALLIALAAQNRMAGHKDDQPQLATLRDAAVSLARSLPFEGNIAPLNYDGAKKQAAILAQFPKLKTDPNAIVEVFRLKGIFQQDDIDLHFSNWAGGNRIEKQLVAFVRQKTPFTEEQMSATIQPLAYKVALLGELLRDFDDHIRPHKAAQRKEWVAFATEVQYTGWELAEVAIAKNADAAKKVIVSLNIACNNCHAKFRE